MYKRIFMGLLLAALFFTASMVLTFAWRQRQSVHSLEGIPFSFVEVDAEIAGDCKMVGDIDGDGYPDLVVGGMPHEKLNWYRYPEWTKTTIATPATEFTTDGALGDVDGDNDLDIVVPDGDSGNNLLWFENPRPDGDAGIGNEWVRHEIGAIGGWGKDVKPADFDGNGLLDVATRNNTQAIIFFQSAANSWNPMPFDHLQMGAEGMAAGDIDDDGDVDLVGQGVWVQNPGGTEAMIAGAWSQWPIGEADASFKALVVDLNQDGKMDVLFSSSENSADVNWWTPVTADPTGGWSKVTIVPALEKAHTLQVADMDRDGDRDVVLAQMHTSQDQEVMVIFNSNGQATRWSKQLVATGGLHNGIVADIGNDGDYDIFGANWTGNPPVKLWLNLLDAAQAPLPLYRWSYKQVTDQHSQTFGLDFGDLSGDGKLDILSGAYWYLNPGGDMMGAWTQRAFPAAMHATLFVNVDNDLLPDVIAHKHEGDIALYWLEATGSTATTWNSIKIGTVDQASHELGAQGRRAAQIEAGGALEIATASGAGIYYFRIPANPENGNWPRIHINTNPSDEGFAFGDIDADGDLDLAATTGAAMGVEWYQNPGNGAADWQAFTVGSFPNAVYPDRTEIADVNGDGRLDIIATEENGEAADAETYWWEQPEDATSNAWTRQLLVSQATTNSMDVADMNQDGTPDIVLGEHRGTQKLSIWGNHGQAYFTEQVVDMGKESHLGARVVDLDNDGDLELVSIAYDQPQFLHLWRNDAIGAGTQPPVTQPPVTPKAAAPLFSPDGGAFTSAISLTISTSTAGASIFYTLDNSEPTTTSLRYEQRFTVATNTIVKARAFKENTLPSAVTTASFTIQSPGQPGDDDERSTEGLVAYYTFREGQGNIVRDVSGVGVPLNLTIQEPAATLWLTSGLQVMSPTVLVSPQAATKVINAIQQSGELSLEAWISHSANDQNGPARILALSVDPFPTGGNFVLGQELNALQVRLRTTESDQYGRPSTDATTDSVDHQFLHVVYTRKASGETEIYLNGEAVATGSAPGTLSNWESSARLSLANEPDGERPWLGTFHLVAIYAHALSASEVALNYSAGIDATPISPSNIRIPHISRGKE